jgi:hypothetical protein
VGPSSPRTISCLVDGGKTKWQLVIGCNLNVVRTRHALKSGPGGTRTHADMTVQCSTNWATGPTQNPILTAQVYPACQWNASSDSLGGDTCWFVHCCLQPFNNNNPERTQEFLPGGGNFSENERGDEGPELHADGVEVWGLARGVFTINYITFCHSTIIISRRCRTEGFCQRNLRANPSARIFRECIVSGE